MTPGLLARQSALLLVAVLCPALASASSETYEGKLVPSSGEAPIPIIVELRDLGGFLTGNVITSPPLMGTGPIEYGRKIARQCELKAVLKDSVVLHLYGTCDPTSFEGTFKIAHSRQKASSGGSFKLDRKASAAAEGDGTSGVSATADSLAACTKFNTRCLVACPRGDYEQESLCADSCRARYQACKRKAGK